MTLIPVRLQGKFPRSRKPAILPIYEHFDRPRLHPRRILELILGRAAIKRVLENAFSDNPMEPAVRISSPGGGDLDYPALQRWEKVEETFKSRRDDRVL